MSRRLGNYVFIGGTKGIGQAAATELAKCGAAILLLARDEAAGEIAVDKMLALGASEAAFFRADLASIAGAELAAKAICDWKPVIHGLTHSAMVGVSKRTLTADGLELAFALQYLARAIINRLCVLKLAASGDGRIVHIAGKTSYKQFQPDLDDLQFAHKKWRLFPALLSSQVCGLMFLYEAAVRWRNKPVRLYASRVGMTRTQVTYSPDTPAVFRLLAPFATTAEKSAANTVRALLDDHSGMKGANIYMNPKSSALDPIFAPSEETSRLWDVTTAIAREHGLELP